MSKQGVVMATRRVKIFSALAALIIIALCLFFYFFYSAKKDPIKVGILHSTSGTMAISEKSVVDATKMAIDEINAQGGLLGRPLQAVFIDGRSDWPYSAKMAEKLINEDKVSVIFGCWTSACRKTVKPVFEKYHHILFYPVQYEGLEQSPNIIYTGAAPNQQIIPAVKWALTNIGKRVFLVGSDYVFPRTANEIIKDQVKAMGGEVVGEEYLLLGSKDVEGIVKKIVATQPNVILNTINGDSNTAFFQALRKAGITPDKIHTMSFSIAEDELRHLDVNQMVGDYATWNYFESVPGLINKLFVERFKKKYGQDRVTDDPMEAAYFGVYLWANAVKAANTPNVNEVLRMLKGQSYAAPEGAVNIDQYNNHTWKWVRIGKIKPDGQFEIVWSSDKAIEPIPFPTYRTKEEWQAFLMNLYKSWGNSWANPGIKMPSSSTDSVLSSTDHIYSEPSNKILTTDSTIKNNTLSTKNITDQNTD